MATNGGATIDPAERAGQYVPSHGLRGLIILSMEKMMITFVGLQESIFIHCEVGMSKNAIVDWCNFWKGGYWFTIESTKCDITGRLTV